MLDITHSQVDVEIEFGVVSLILVFLYTLASIFSFLQVSSRDHERLLTSSVQHFLLCGILQEK